MATPLPPGGLERFVRWMNFPKPHRGRAVAVVDAIWSADDASPFAIAPAPWVIDNVGVPQTFEDREC